MKWKHKTLINITRQGPSKFYCNSLPKLQSKAYKGNNILSFLVPKSIMQYPASHGPPVLRKIHGLPTADCRDSFTVTNAVCNEYSNLATTPNNSRAETEKTRANNEQINEYTFNVNN